MKSNEFRMKDSFTEKFFNMEKEYSLFSLKSKNGFPIWDIVRYSISNELKKELDSAYKLNVEIIKEKRNFFKTFRYLIKLVKSLYYILKPLNQNLFFIASRIKNSNDQFFDNTADSAIEYFDKKEISIIETESNQRKINYKYDEYKVIFHLIITLILRYKNKREPISTEQIRHMQRAIDDTFPILKNRFSLDGIIYKEMKRFINSFAFYDWLFTKNRKRIKMLFVTQNGIQKGLYYAAKKNNIKIIEFQHGIIDFTHIAYSYNFRIDYKINDVINPDILLTFSDYWINHFFNPFIKALPVGNDYFYQKISPTDNKQFLTIISSRNHDNELRSFTELIANKRPEISIIYKLHPDQAAEFEFLRGFFKRFENIEVIFNKTTVKDLLSKSNVMFTIASTAVYEALHNNVKTIILRRQNYFIHNDIFDMANVYLIDNIEEFLIAFDELNLINKDNKDVFYKAFDRKLFIKSIK